MDNDCDAQLPTQHDLQLVPAHMPARSLSPANDDYQTADDYDDDDDINDGDESDEEVTFNVRHKGKHPVSTFKDELCELNNDDDNDDDGIEDKVNDNDAIAGTSGCDELNEELNDGYESEFDDKLRQVSNGENSRPSVTPSSQPVGLRRSLRTKKPKVVFDPSTY